MSAGHNGMINTYECPCGHTWEDEWDCGCDDDCPECGSTCSPTKSEFHQPCDHPECEEQDDGE